MATFDRSLVLAIGLSMAISSMPCALAEENVETAKPNAFKKVLKKLRHPLKKLDSAKSAETTEVKEQSAVMTEMPSAAPISPVDAATADAANDVPGVNVTPSQFKYPSIEENPVPWYRPIKRIMYPVENLAKTSVLLGQQIMRLEAPIASLQPSMLGLKQEMGNVQTRMQDMQGNLGSMQGSVKGVRGDLTGVRGDLTGVRGDVTRVRGDLSAVRGDLGGMQRHIVQLEQPIRELRDPIVRLEKPLNEVAQPVSTVQKQLASVDSELKDLKLLLSTVLASIYIAAGAIAFGTPLAAFLVYKNRHRLFPNTRERDFPVANTPEKR